MCRGPASSRKRRFDRRQRHYEAHSQPFIAQALEFTRESGISLAACMRRKCPPSRDEEIGPGERLWLGKVFECRRIALDLVEISEFKRHIDGVGIEAQLIVADTSGGDENLGLRQSATLRFRPLQSSCERAENVSTVKRPPELFAQGYSLLQQVDRLGPVPFGKPETPK
jgi:hypothetical protein